MTPSVTLSTKATVLQLLDMVVTDTSASLSARREPELLELLTTLFCVCYDDSYGSEDWDSSSASRNEPE